MKGFAQRLLRSTFIDARLAVARLWWAVRQIFGDAAYENYLRSARARDETTQGGSASAPLSPAEFYLDSLRRRYSRVSRCC
ncbi:MAG: CstA-like transporter-associated (seleno)protein [Candidatus Acidiferrales bacterium]